MLFDLMFWVFFVIMYVFKMEYVDLNSISLYFVLYNGIREESEDWKKISYGSKGFNFWEE